MTSPRTCTLTLLLCGLFSRAEAFAEAPPQPSLPQQQSATPVASVEPAPEVEPKRPAVSDAMLEPPTAARQTLASWEAATTLLRARSTDLRIAEGEIRRAAGQARVALAGALPTLNAQGAAAHQIYSSESDSGAFTGSGRNTLSGRVTISQPLIDARAFHGIQTAHVTEDVARLSYAETQRELLLNLASVIVASVTAERVAELNRQGLRNALERLQLTQAKERTGSGTGLDIIRAEQDVAATRAGIVSADEAVIQAREALGLALGFSEPVGVAREMDLSGLEQGAARTCKPITALTARADLQRATKTITLAERRQHEVDLGHLPTLSAQSSLSTNASDAGGGFRTTWDIEAVLSIPIWDGGARYGEQTQAHAATDQSQQQLTALTRSTRVRLTQAERAVAVATRAREVAETQRNLAEQVDRLTLSAYRTGKGTSLDLVVSAGTLRQAELSLALSEFNVVKARLARLLELANCVGGR